MSLWDEASTDARTGFAVGTREDHINRWHMGKRAVDRFVEQLLRETAVVAYLESGIARPGSLAEWLRSGAGLFIGEPQP